MCNRWMIGVTICCVVVDVGDEDVVDDRDRRTIIRENRQLKREKEEVVQKNGSLAKRVKVAEMKEVLAERIEKGERLLRLGYAIDKGGGERVSVM